MSEYLLTTLFQITSSDKHYNNISFDYANLLGKYLALAGDLASIHRASFDIFDEDIEGKQSLSVT